MRTFSPRQRNLLRQQAAREASAENIKQSILRGEDVSGAFATLATPEPVDREARAEIECFRCDIPMDETSEEYGVLTVSAFSSTLNAEPIRYRAEFAVLLPICANCREHFEVVVSEQEV